MLAAGRDLHEESLASEKGLRAVLELPFDSLVNLELKIIVDQIRGLNKSIAELEAVIGREGQKLEGQGNVTSIQGIGRQWGYSVVGEDRRSASEIRPARDSRKVSSSRVEVDTDKQLLRVAKKILGLKLVRGDQADRSPGEVSRLRVCLFETCTRFLAVPLIEDVVCKLRDLKAALPNWYKAGNLSDCTHGPGILDRRRCRFGASRSTSSLLAARGTVWRLISWRDLGIQTEVSSTAV